MKQNVAGGVASICFLVVYTSVSLASQQHPRPQHKHQQFERNLLWCWSMSSARIARAGCPSEISRKKTFVCLIIGAKSGLPLLTPGNSTTLDPSRFGLS